MKSISEIVEELYTVASKRAHKFAVSKSKNFVCWRVEKGGWFSVRHLFVSEYSRGCIRFSSKILGRIPKTIFPFAIDESEVSGRVEITVHIDELDSKMFDRILDAQEAPKESLDPQIFKEPDNFPGYAWSKKAWDQQEANRRR